MPDRVENWDLTNYPWKTNKGDILTSFFKVVYENPDGSTGFHTYKDDTGREVPYALRVGDVTTLPNPKPDKVREDSEEWHGMISRIKPEDLRRVEKEIGGKPSTVLAGLWHSLDANGEWIEVDREKVRYPLYWAKVTDRYYEWRNEAYAGKSDPYKDQKRPYTKIQELEQKLASAAGEIAERDRKAIEVNKSLMEENKKLAEKLKEAGVKA